jgi:predicted permease
MISVFIDFYAVIAIVFITGLSFLIFKKEALPADGINRITEFSFYLAVCVAVIRAIYAVLTISGTSQMGVPLSFCLMLLLYAAILRLIAILIVRFKKKR